MKWEAGARLMRLQKSLIALGYSLPKHGSDGFPGHETARAISEFAQDHRIGGDSVDDVEPTRELLSQVEAAIGAICLRQSTALPSMAEDISQYTGKHVRGLRDWIDVDAIVLHQTAYEMGESPQSWYELRAHVGITRSGRIYLVNNLDALMWHANSLNARSIGIEVSGNFRGDESDDRTLWKPAIGYDPARHGPHDLGVDQAGATRVAMRWICETVAHHGGKVRYVFAHRQSSKDRIGDPGSAIWRECGVWAQRELGLSDGGAGAKFGHGRALPDVWTGARRGVPYYGG